jgi:hypothetical protein
MKKLISKKLVCENQMRDYDLIKESGPGGSTILKLSGIFAQAETDNNNGRRYHLEEMVEECRKFQDVINSHRALGELEHPDDVIINPDRVCCRITKYQQDRSNENNFLGEAIIMCGDPKAGIPGTPCGTIVGSLLQYGTKMGFSTRGLGNPEEDDEGHTYVGDYQLVTIDCVLDPSIGQFCDAKNETKQVRGILESVEFLVDSNRLVVESRVIDRFKKDLKVLPNDQAEKFMKMKGAVDRFLRSI